MQTVSATHAKQNFAAILDAAQRGPVMIQRHERNIAVLISAEEYKRIRQMSAQKRMQAGLSPSGYFERE
jgi:prevent-host-death family protein